MKNKRRGDIIQPFLMKTPENKGLSAFFSPHLIKSRFIQRVIGFVIAFVAISGISGSWLISTNRLLFEFHFDIYGSAGKAILFGVVVFFLLTRDRITQLDISAWKPTNFIFCGLSLISLGLFFFGASQLLQYQAATQAPLLTIFTHSMLWLSGLSITIGIFGTEFIRQLWQKCRSELLVTAGLSTIFYFLFGFIFQLWPYLSKIVLWAVLGLLHLTEPSVKVVPPLTLQLPEFAITIGEYCSGIESLFLITTLYLLIGCLEWRRLRKIAFLLHYFPLIIGMFGLNIVRVYVIIQAGVLFNPEIAAKLFHTYLGMILFMVYFFLFWTWSAPNVIQKPKPTGEETI